MKSAKSDLRTLLTVFCMNQRGASRSRSATCSSLKLFLLHAAFILSLVPDGALQLPSGALFCTRAIRPSSQVLTAQFNQVDFFKRVLLKQIDFQSLGSSSAKQIQSLSSVKGGDKLINIHPYTAKPFLFVGMTAFHSSSICTLL
ncbi:hypothetical protein [Pantoea sp. JZ29]|uniref:hypothetical protein n=1 Tax=Pantoea sp. JZ29 TaxID=2654192 RepID=UPI002B478479|nr:hypothetical protein [Pantoea sp. JZ29]